MKTRRHLLISDTHFGHFKLVNSGYRPDGFEIQILDNLHKVSIPTDILICLGDVSFYRHEIWQKKLLKSFNGTHAWLVKGNHDYQSDNWYLNIGWDFVGEQISLTRFKKKILFTHIPMDDISKWDLNIHGHMHSGVHHPEIKLAGKHKLISMENNNYHPTILQDICNEPIIGELNEH